MAIYLLRVNVFVLCIFGFQMKQGPSESHIHPCETVIHTDANERNWFFRIVFHKIFGHLTVVLVAIIR